MFKRWSIVTLGTLSALALLAGPASFAEQDDEGEEEGRFAKTVPADPKGTVLVKNVAGEVRIVGSTRSEVEIQATYEEGVERIDVVTERGRTRIEVVLPKRDDKRGDKRRRHRNGDAHLEIRVPQGSELEVQTVSAEIEVRDVLGRQRLRSVSGNVETDLEQSDMQLETVSGDVMIRGRGKPTNLRARTVSGNLTLTRAAGEIDATTTSGDLILEVDPARDVRVRTTSGNLRLSGDLAPAGEVEADTVSGELSVRLRSPGFRYDVSTFSGDIDTCMGQKPERASEYGPGMLLNGVHGNGKGDVRLKTMSGDVEICPK
jgi:DUF4097 and DUF4098 domain-containing protein YvlB